MTITAVLHRSHEGEVCFRPSLFRRWFLRQPTVTLWVTRDRYGLWRYDGDGDGRIVTGRAAEELRFEGHAARFLARRRA